MIDYKVVRTFHPIGQGAFYSERHESFNVVYDCGAMPLSKYAKDVVKNAFTVEEDIDVLFISHFDYDHVSAIATLIKSVGHIRTVVLPLLDNSHRKLLVNINRMLSHNIVKLINEPESFFGSETIVMYVSPSEGEPSEENRDLREFSPINNKKTRTISSGTSLNFGSNVDWRFIPFNYQHHSRSLDLKSLLHKEGFDIDKLQQNSDYTLTCLTDTESRKTLRKIYSRLDGNVNENSMLVYSGPAYSKDEEYDYICDCVEERLCWPNCWGGDKPACIYTGDCDLNKVKLDKVYSRFMKYVGVIQVPHHGSKHNFTLESYLQFWPPVISPISFGLKNRYGHPSAQVVNKLSISGNRPILVNEDPESKFVQEMSISNKKLMAVKRKIGSFSYG
jgi:hypothetical protein